MKIVRVVVFGKVQGVWYRAWTAEQARNRGLSGWVRNRCDGSVEAVFSGLDHQIDIIAPFASFSKSEVIERGVALGVPWELTLSCMNPDRFSHCGRCSKCRERLQAFKKAGFRDPANYAFRPKDIMTGC